MLGLLRGTGVSTTHEYDDFQAGIDNNGDGDIADVGDDVLVSDDFNSNQVSLTYDNNGNLTLDIAVAARRRRSRSDPATALPPQCQGLTNDGVYKFEYDAWNRLRKTILTDGSDETTIGEYEYYADNRRAKKTVSDRGEEIVENDGGNTTVLCYYCGTGFQPVGRWNICETRNGSNQTTFQHLWGTRYTDELIWLEKNGDPTESNDTNPDDQSSESTADTRYFVHQDRNWNVVALSEYDTAGTNNGRIVERYSYTPYGSFVVLKGDSGNGELDNVSLTSTVGNPFAHQGLALDQEKTSCQNRHREYVSPLQRFIQRDPLTSRPLAGAGYRDGQSLYAYLGALPVGRRDPSGLLWEGCYECTCSKTGQFKVLGVCFWSVCTCTCDLCFCSLEPCPDPQSILVYALCDCSDDACDSKDGFYVLRDTGPSGRRESCPGCDGE
jgi:RHS repeat-associated protein